MDKLRPQQFEVFCLTHGQLAIIVQAHLGLNIFEEHRQEFDGCKGVEIKPFVEEVDELTNKLSCDKGNHMARSLANSPVHKKHKFK